jgi:ketosteroid isomerase-like protein
VPESARDLYLRFLDLIGQERWEELADLYAEDVVVEQPYARPEPGVIRGREALRERFAGRRELPVTLVPANVVIRETTDPEVIVAEFDYDVTVTGSGERFRTANVIVLRVRDGLIVESRDFHDVPRIREAMARASA